MILLDTSSVIALTNEYDEFHGKAKNKLKSIAESSDVLITHNYVILESIALVQKRADLETAQDIQQLFEEVEVIWIDSDYHDKARKKWKSESSQGLSFVDCTSFVVADSEGIEKVFTFDDDFKDQGFEVY